MRLKRRTFFKLTVAGTAAAVARRRPRRHRPATGPRAPTRWASSWTRRKCVGCRACEAACAEANHLDRIAEVARRHASSTRAGPRQPDVFTVVNRADGGQRAGEVALRQDAVHALPGAGVRDGVPRPRAREDAVGPGGLPRRPAAWAAVTACWPARSTSRSTEYTSATPRVRKCTFCAERQAQGPRAGLHVGLPVGRAAVRQARGAARRSQAAASTASPTSTCRSSTASTRLAARAGSTSATARREQLGLKTDVPDDALQRARAERARRRARRHHAVAPAADGPLRVPAKRRRGGPPRRTHHG